jgi:uncharacterized membrane protein
MERLVEEFSIFELVEAAALAIELLAIAIILIAIIVSTWRYVSRQLQRDGRERDAYGDYREGLAKSLLIGLEVLVAADVVRTVALEPTLQSVALLGLLVIIRTFLSWSLVVELEGRWPWQAAKSADTPMTAERRTMDE